MQPEDHVAVHCGDPSEDQQECHTSVLILRELLFQMHLEDRAVVHCGDLNGDHVVVHHEGRGEDLRLDHEGHGEDQWSAVWVP